jgi:hypothetical protein
VVADFALPIRDRAVKSTTPEITARPLQIQLTIANSRLLTILIVLVTLVRARSRLFFQALSAVVADVFLREELSAP